MMYGIFGTTTVCYRGSMTVSTIEIPLASTVGYVDHGEFDERAIAPATAEELEHERIETGGRFVR